MSQTILLFGKLRDAFGADSINAPTNVATVADLRAALVEEHQHLADSLTSTAVRVAVNQELVSDEAATQIKATDEIALLPPLSGG